MNLRILACFDEKMRMIHSLATQKEFLSTYPNIPYAARVFLLTDLPPPIFWDA